MPFNVTSKVSHLCDIFLQSTQSKSVSSMSLFVRFYEQTRKGLFKFVKWMKESDHQKDKIKQKTEILTSLGLTDVGDDYDLVEFDFSSPTTFQKIPGLNETQTKQAVEDRLNTRLQNFIGADKESSPNGPLDIATFRRFCESTYNEITEEIDIINSKKRRNHEIMTSARKISVLDEKVDEVYTQQITGILDTSSSKQASLNIDEETCSRQLAYLRDLCGGKPCRLKTSSKNQLTLSQKHKLQDWQNAGSVTNAM